MAEKLRQSDIDWILKLYKIYGSYKEVADRTGFSAVVIRKYILEHNKNTRERLTRKYGQPSNDEIPETRPILEVNKKYRLQKLYMDQENRKDYPEPAIKVMVIKEHPHLYACKIIGTNYITCINKCDMYLYEIKEVA